MAYDGTFYKFGSLPLDVLPVQDPTRRCGTREAPRRRRRGGFNLLGRGPEDVTSYWQL